MRLNIDIAVIMLNFSFNSYLVGLKQVDVWIHSQLNYRYIFWLKLYNSLRDSRIYMHCTICSEIYCATVHQSAQPKYKNNTYEKDISIIYLTIKSPIQQWVLRSQSVKCPGAAKFWKRKSNDTVQGSCRLVSFLLRNSWGRAVQSGTVLEWSRWAFNSTVDFYC